jgi:anti-sigma factor RsiW
VNTAGDGHSGWPEKLLDALDGALTAEEQRALESHVASCASCTALHRRLALLDRALRERVGLPTLEAAFDRRVLERVRAMEAVDPAELRARREREREAFCSQLELHLRSARRVLIANLAAAASVLLAVVLLRPEAALAFLQRSYEGALQQLPQQPVLTVALTIAAVALGLTVAQARR